jgi:riboflavin kinase/FMN adenylyltransferase
MILHNDYKKFAESARDSILAIGNFDGVHLGHRSLIAAAREVAIRLKAPLGVMTFEPHPREVLQPGGEPFRLTLLPMKQRLFAGMGVDALLAPAFDAVFSSITADGFIHDVLKGKLGARHIVVGEDFTFGHKRGGNADTLKKAEKEGVFGLTLVSPARCEGHDIYSSTRIRDHVRKGELDDAARLMGHPFEMEAEIVRGDQRGRTIGYPTANQRVSRYVRLPYGIYAVRVLIEGEKTWRQGVASYGIRPMFEVPEPLLETYIFGFDQEIYGKQMRVQPVKFLRPEMKFDGLEALKAGIGQDCAAARSYLQSEPLQET